MESAAEDFSDNSDNIGAADFKDRKIAYCQRFAILHLSAFRPHYKKGETLGRSPERWRNVSEHCLVAGIFADILADELHLSSDDKEKVVKAAILHDWDKKHESMEIGQARREDKLTLKTLEKIKEHDQQVLKEMKVPADVISLTEANIPKTTEGPSALAEKIIWYTDAMLSNTEPVPIKQRFNDLERGWDGEKDDPDRAERNRAFSDLYRDKYGGKSLYEVQRELGDKISAEFAEIMGYGGEITNLPFYLKEKFEERVRSYGE